jgi:hypothetical protein
VVILLTSMRGEPPAAVLGNDDQAHGIEVTSTFYDVRGIVPDRLYKDHARSHSQPVLSINFTCLVLLCNRAVTHRLNPPQLPQPALQPHYNNMQTSSPSFRDQVAAALVIASSDSPGHSEPKKIFHNKVFVLADQLHDLRHNRKAPAWILNHGRQLIELNPDGSRGQKWWSCQICEEANKSKLYVMTATTSAMHHLSRFVNFRHCCV